MYVPAARFRRGVEILVLNVSGTAAQCTTYGIMCAERFVDTERPTFCRSLLRKPEVNRLPTCVCAGGMVVCRGCNDQLPSGAITSLNTV
jgi:hypothetical protein